MDRPYGLLQHHKRAVGTLSTGKISSWRAAHGKIRGLTNIQSTVKSDAILDFSFGDSFNGVLIHRTILFFLNNYVLAVVCLNNNNNNRSINKILRCLLSSSHFLAEDSGSVQPFVGSCWMCGRMAAHSFHWLRQIGPASGSADPFEVVLQMAADSQNTLHALFEQ